MSATIMEAVAEVDQTRRAAISVAAFLQCTNLGGMEKVAYSLFDQLGRQGLKIRFATPRPWGSGESRVRQADPAARSFAYRGKFGWRTFQSFSRHARELAGECEKVWVIGTCASCLSAARLAGRKVLLSHHYHHFENRASRLRWSAFYLAFGSGIDIVTFPTEFTRREALQIAPWLEPKMRVVRNGFDVYYESEEQRLADKQSARARLGLPQDAFLIGNGGWLIKRKRFDVFLKTAKIVAARFPGARFYICGGGPEEANLRRLAAELGIADKVHFEGWVQNMADYYRSWDVLLFNSDFDALGCTPLEAASHGCPSVASCSYGGLSEFIADGETGFILDRHEPEKLAAALITLARDGVLALKIRQRAVEKIRRDFSSEKALGFYENYFHGALV